MQIFKTNKCMHAGPHCSRTVIYAAHMSRGSSSYTDRYLLRASARPQQQTRRPPLLLLIDGTDGRTDRRTLDHFMTLTGYYVGRVIITKVVRNLFTSKITRKQSWFLTIVMWFPHNFHSLPKTFDHFRPNNIATTHSSLVWIKSRGKIEKLLVV